LFLNAADSQASYPYEKPDRKHRRDDGANLVLLAACDTRPALPRSPAARGALEDVREIRRITRSEIDAATQAQNQQALVGAARCDVRVVQLVYDTVGVDGEATDASAALLLPEGEACPVSHPLMAADHGTRTQRSASMIDVEAGDTYVSQLAAQGYAVVAPDYLGLGRSRYPFHPYLHADSEASATIDALRAARLAAKRLRASYSDQVMLTGYSQGGHAAMATQREIERRHLGEFNLVASAPMAGPYALQQTFLQGWSGESAGRVNVFAPLLVAYTLVSYQRIYGDIYGSIGEALREPYAQRSGQLLPGPLDVFALLGQGLFPPGNQMGELRQPRLTEDFRNNPNNHFRRALARNDLLDWTPRTPMLLCGAAQDSVVQFDNARSAQAAFATRGVQVPVIDVGPRLPAGAEGHTGDPLCFAAVREALFDRVRAPAAGS
jgi:pimeloyl-ACP methyl ester carboxylesterase